MQEQSEVRFVVQDDNVLGYINRAQPGSVCILATSMIRGSIYGPFYGPIPSHPLRQRPATRQDFVDYRVDTEGYMNDPRYDFPDN